MDDNKIAPGEDCPERSRFLMAEPESLIGTRIYAHHNIKIDTDYLAYDTQLERLLNIDLPLDESGDLAARSIALSGNAYHLWVDAYNSIERASGQGGALENYQAYASKLAEQMLRIAGVITLYENPEAVEITEATMQGAICLSQYYLNEATRLLLGPSNPLLADLTVTTAPFNALVVRSK